MTRTRKTVAIVSPKQKVAVLVRRRNPQEGSLAHRLRPKLKNGKQKERGPGKINDPVNKARGHRCRSEGKGNSLHSTRLDKCQRFGARSTVSSFRNHDSCPGPYSTEVKISGSERRKPIFGSRNCTTVGRPASWTVGRLVYSSQRSEVVAPPSAQQQRKLSTPCDGTEKASEPCHECPLCLDSAARAAASAAATADSTVNGGTPHPWTNVPTNNEPTNDGCFEASPRHRSKAVDLETIGAKRKLISTSNAQTSTTGNTKRRGVL
ncbi:substance-K receptor-like [Ixodes scapularis]